MRTTNKIMIPALALAILLAVAALGIVLWKNRPTSKGDPKLFDFE